MILRLLFLILTASYITYGAIKTDLTKFSNDLNLLNSKIPISPAKSLREAVEKGDIALLQQLIAQGADVNKKYSDEGLTALMLAAANNASEMIGMLAEAGAKVNAAIEGREEYGSGEPVLRFAIDTNATKALQKLLQLGAKPNNLTSNLPSSWGLCAKNISLLSYAIGKSASPHIIHELINGGAEINAYAAGNDFWNPLTVAAYVGNADAVQQLLAAKADKTLKNRHGKTALDYAQEKGHTEIIKLLR